MFRTKYLWAGLALALAIAFAGCGRSFYTGGDSETHFLKTCNGACDAGLTCWCGVCTKTCDSDSECSSLNGAASCLSVAGAACGTSQTSCDVTCNDDRDCNVVGASYRCDATGVCRVAALGFGASTGSTNASSAASNGGSGGTTTTSSGGTADTTATTSANVGGGGGTPGIDCCLEHEIEWEVGGGFGGPLPRYTLAGCSTFLQANPRPESNCQSDLPACEESERPGRELELTPEDINGLLADSDVQDALAAAPVTYGVDLRILDGHVFLLDISGHSIVIGAECPDDDSNCLPIPDGLRVLKLTLDRIVMQQINWGSCEQEPVCDTELGVEPCDARIPRWHFDAALHRCVEFDYGGCAEGLNNFASRTECEQTCDNDPCSYGRPLTDPADCATETAAAGFCFADPGAACECACHHDGGSLSDCVILQQVPAAASCYPQE